MSDDEVIDLAGSDDEVALKEEDKLSLRLFGLPPSQQPEPERDYHTTPAAPAVPTTRTNATSAATPRFDTDAAYAALLQRRELELAMEEKEGTRHTTAGNFTSPDSDSRSSNLSPPPALQAELIRQHRDQLYSHEPHVQVHDLFVLYSSLFFRDSLASVSVRWSNRMTMCAGLCRYDVRGGGCEIALSESLLRYRSKQEVVETLLHEMIHAFLFVGDPTQRDHDAHGPNFCSHMARINALLGLHITVYHTFHEEVKLFKRHVWQCQGKCKNWKP